MGVAPVWHRELMERCPPLIGSEPDWENPEARRRYRELMIVSHLLGVHPSPFQKYVLALLADPVTRTLVLMVGRQQGKTLVLMIWLTWRALFHARETEIYSVQDASESNAKLKKELKPLLDVSGLEADAGYSFRLQAGAEYGPNFGNASYVRSLSRSKHSGRGETRTGAAVIDEANTDRDSNRLTIITPFQTTVSDGQMVISGTAGDVDSAMFAAQIGKAVEAERTGDRTWKIAYWGLGLPHERTPDHDPGSEAVWRRVLPGLGYVCEPPAIGAAQRRMEEWQFAQEYLGCWLLTSSDMCFSRAAWRALQTGEMPNVTGGLWVGVDCHPTDPRLGIAVCDDSGIVSRPDGFGDLLSAERGLLDLHERRDVRCVSLPARGALAAVADELEDAGVTVERRDLHGMHRDAQTFWLAATAHPRRVAILSEETFDISNDTSMRHDTKGGWLFRRQHEAGWACPLTAASLAFAAAERDMKQDDTWEQLEADWAEVVAAVDGSDDSSDDSSDEWVDEWEEALAAANG